MTRLPSHFYAMVDPAGGHDPVSLAETLLDVVGRDSNHFIRPGDSSRGFEREIGLPEMHSVSVG